MMASFVEFDLHKIVGIRLLDATPKDAATVARQLGLPRTSLDREPDLFIRFVDRLPTSSPVRYIGVEDAGFTQDAFLVLHSVHKIPARVQIPFERVGKQCEILCERGLPAVPLLIPILNLTILNKGVLPLHASAFSYRGCGILVTGWAKGGKTETLLAFMANGARYIGDEWIYLSNEPSRMAGIPEPIRLWEWHLSDMPQYQARIDSGDRLKLRTLKVLTGALDWLAKASPSSKLAGRLKSMLKRQQYVQTPPQRLFGQEACIFQGALNKVFFVISSETPGIRVEPAQPQEIAQRMVLCSQAEYADLHSYYQKFRFAFPSQRNEVIEQAEALQFEALQRLLAGKEAFTVYHPYPVHIPDLYRVLQPYFA